MRVMIDVYIYFYSIGYWSELNSLVLPNMDIFME